MSDSIFTSTHPDVLAAWANHEAEYKQWCEAWTTQIQAWGFDPEKNKPFVTDGVWGGCSLVGVYWGFGREAIPAGWKRVDSSRLRHVIEPYRAKAKAVPEIQREYKALVKVPDIRRDLTAFGMPQHVFTGLRVTTYAARLLDNPRAVWIRWRDAEPEVDSQWWDRIKLSDYYLMVENGCDPFARSDEAEAS